MKKLLLIGIILAGVGCNSSGTNDASKDSSVDVKPIQNVNGNIPDTTNGGEIVGNKKPDSTKIDSTYADTSKKIKTKK